MSPTELLTSPLDAWHRAQGGRMVGFAGWSMPLHYAHNITHEHLAVRGACGLFDVSHMGRLWFEGRQAAEFLSRVLTRDVRRLTVGRVRYALVCHASGGTLDDVLVSRVPSEAEGDAVRFLLVVNASNRLRVLEHFERVRAEHPDLAEAQWHDATAEQAMIALQGPQADAVLRQVADVPTLRNYRIGPGRWNNHSLWISRTGYTGEDGYELVLPAKRAAALCDQLLEAGRSAGLEPAGLACRDTLRLEAAMPLYGHELTDEFDPLMAGLEFAVDLEAGGFIGHERLRALAALPNRPRRVGLRLAGRRIARQGAQILPLGQSTETSIGTVTSGTFSPTFEAALAMGYVLPEYAQVGTQVLVDVRGTAEAAEVVPLPFYTRGEAP